MTAPDSWSRSDWWRAYYEVAFRNMNTAHQISEGQIIRHVEVVTDHDGTVWLGWETGPTPFTHHWMILKEP